MNGFDTALNAARRAKEWRELKADPRVDLLVIGAGITGAGIALDAASRGLKVVLAEKHDLAFGTSRWSSKLAHGGLRYLSKMRVKIAYNSARERKIIMERTAPHLTRALAQVTPINSYLSPLQTVAVRCGYLAGDILALAAGTKRSTLPRSRFAGRKEAEKLLPRALKQGLKGAWVNYDGQMTDDARFVVAVARTAAGEGAKIFTYCPVSEACGSGALLTDKFTGESFYLHAKAVIGAAGVWAGELDPRIKIRPSRGTHLVFDSRTFGNPAGALTIPLKGSVSRYLFILPADKNRCYLGLTDEDQPGEIPDVPPTPEEDIEFLLEGINPALERAVGREDIRGMFTGLRPLLTDGSGSSTADLSRRHAIVKSGSGIISVVGGKFTEYRLMAQEALDTAVKSANLHAGKCRTRNFPLVGAPGHKENTPDDPKEVCKFPKFLLRRFGLETKRMADAAVLPNPLRRIAGLDLVRAEIEYALTHEGAMCVEDILERRTRLSLVPGQARAARKEITEIFNALFPFPGVPSASPSGRNGKREERE